MFNCFNKFIKLFQFHLCFSLTVDFMKFHEIIHSRSQLTVIFTYISVHKIVVYIKI